jgi:hypothetical protein
LEADEGVEGPTDEDEEEEEERGRADAGAVGDP